MPPLEDEIQVMLAAMDSPMAEFIGLRDRLERGSDSPFPSEEIDFVNWLQPRQPRRVIELGMGRGGFSTDIIRCLAPDAKMFTVEITGCDGLRVDLWLEGLARWEQQIRFREGDSMDSQVVEDALEFLGEPPDFIFLDTDHTLESTRRERDIYWPLLEPGGAMGFHDIYTQLNAVHLVWRRMQQEASEAHEFVNMGSYAECMARGGHCYGIGVVVK